MCTVNRLGQIVSYAESGEGMSKYYPTPPPVGTIRTIKILTDPGCARDSYGCEVKFEDVLTSTTGREVGTHWDLAWCEPGEIYNFVFTGQKWAPQELLSTSSEGRSDGTLLSVD